MKFNSKAELHLHIGRRNYFKKKIEVKDCLSNVKIDGLVHSSPLAETILFSFKVYPNGFAITNGNQELFGFRFNEVDCYSLKRISENEIHITFFINPANKFICKIEPNEFNALIVLLRSLPLRFSKDNRNQVTIQSDINLLSREFASLKNDQNAYSFDLLDTSTFGRVATLHINTEEIYYNDRLLKVNDAIGFSYGIMVNKAYGATVSENYDIIIHTKDKSSFRISFSKKAGISTPQEDKVTFSKIINILFNLISRKLVVEWIDKFAQSEIIEYADITISREGILVKKRKEPILMYWDEIIVQPQLVRWRYNNTVFAEINGHYDRRTVMLMFFSNWLLEDKNRLLKLLGTSTLVYDKIQEQSDLTIDNLTD